MRKFVIAVVSVIGGALMMSSAARADCGEVSVTQMNWASGAMIAELNKFILEQGYGCEVVLVPSATITSVTSVAETGKPDIINELWLNSAAVYPELEAQGKIVTVSNVFSEGGVENWYIPDYLAEAHPELMTIEGVLANPDLVGARFHNCPDGWGCRIANDSLSSAQVFDLEGHGIEVFDHGSGETLAASIAAAFEAQEPWFGYYWGPTAVLGKYSMVAVDLGPVDEEIHACNQSKECQNPGISSYPPAPVLIGVTPDLISREPEVAEFMGNMTFTTEQMSKVLAWQEDNSASPEEAAVYFLSNYKDVWSSWISDEARSNLGAFLQ